MPVLWGCPPAGSEDAHGACSGAGVLSYPRPHLLLSCRVPRALSVAPVPGAVTVLLAPPGPQEALVHEVPRACRARR